MAYLGYVFFVSFWGYYFLFGFLVVCGVVARLLVVLGKSRPRSVGLVGKFGKSELDYLGKDWRRLGLREGYSR